MNTNPVAGIARDLNLTRPVNSFDKGMSYDELLDRACAEYWRNRPTEPKPAVTDVAVPA